jgi:aminopeptidase N
MFLFRVDVNLKYQTYCNAIADGGQEEWDFAWERYQNSNVASEKATILRALACTKEVWLLNRLVLGWNI